MKIVALLTIQNIYPTIQNIVAKKFDGLRSDMYIEVYIEKHLRISI